jgi:YkoY family integral membrane protein
MLDQLSSYSSLFSADVLLLLPVLVALEVVLSADNAIALAAIAQGLADQQMQRRALNFGLVIAFCLRVALILTATWVIQFWQFELLGAAYLLWLVFQYFSSAEEKDKTGQHPHHGPRFSSLWQAIPMIAVTDLAFSLDSVTTAIAVSKDTWLVLTGGLIGVVALRFMAGLFIRWLAEFEHLEDAGYITVAFVGLRLLLRVFDSSFIPPEWLMITLVALVFAWGFSKRVDQVDQAEEVAPAAIEVQSPAEPREEISVES